MERTQFLQILSKYIEGRATEEEEAFLLAYYDLFVVDADVMKLISAEEQQQLKLMMKANIDGEIDRKVTRHPTIGTNASKYKLMTRQVWLASAAAVAAITLGVWLYYTSSLRSSRHSEFISGSPNYANDIAPGKNTATLTLANGEVIKLSDAKTGVVIDASKLTYSDGTAITPSLRGTEAISHMLTASTPRGGQYQVVLPDGTKVWLNADSKISFPSQFSGKERKVLLEGEAYFAVVHNAKQPFRVESRGQVVEDIGTEFNISAYRDEKEVKTTLVEGEAAVYTPQARSELRYRLKPKQQSVLVAAADGAVPKLEIRQVNTENIVDWKENDFVLDGTDFRTAMRKIARWYNVEIEYDADAPLNPKIGGWISRNNNISAVLELLSSTGQVHFKIEGRRVRVTK